MSGRGLIIYARSSSRRSCSLIMHPSRGTMIIREGCTHIRERHTHHPAALAICKINNIGILKSRIHNARNPRNPTNSRNLWRFQAVSRDLHDSTHAHYNAYEAATPAHDPRRGGWLWPLCYCGLTEANRAHAQEPCALHDETEMQKHRQAAHRARPIRAMHPPTAGKHAASSRAPSTGRCRPIACAPAGHESPAWPAALAAAHQDEKARRSHKPSLDSMPVLPSLSATARMRHGSVSMGTADVAVRARLESSPVMRQTTDQ